MSKSFYLINQICKIAGGAQLVARIKPWPTSSTWRTPWPARSSRAVAARPFASMAANRRTRKRRRTTASPRCLAKRCSAVSAPPQTTAGCRQWPVRVRTARADCACGLRVRTARATAAVRATAAAAAAAAATAAAAAAAAATLTTTTPWHVTRQGAFVRLLAFRRRRRQLLHRNGVRGHHGAGLAGRRDRGTLRAHSEHSHRGGATCHLGTARDLVGSLSHCFQRRAVLCRAVLCQSAAGPCCAKVLPRRAALCRAALLYTDRACTPPPPPKWPPPTSAPFPAGVRTTCCAPDQPMARPASGCFRATRIAPPPPVTPTRTHRSRLHLLPLPPPPPRGCSHCHRRLVVSGHRVWCGRGVPRARFYSTIGHSDRR